MTTVSHTPEKRTRVASVTPSPVGKAIEKSNTTTTNECSPSNGSGKTNNANEEDSFDPICQLQPEIGDRVFCKHKNGYWYWGTVKDKFWKRKFLYYSVSRYLLVEKGDCFFADRTKKRLTMKMHYFKYRFNTTMESTSSSTKLPTELRQNFNIITWMMPKTMSK